VPYLAQSDTIWLESPPKATKITIVWRGMILTTPDN
jgi:hypothetical protein